MDLHHSKNSRATIGGPKAKMTTQNSAGAHASRMRSCTNILLDRLSGPHIGRQGPLCAGVTCEDLDAHLPSEYDGLEAISLCAQQSISDRLWVARKRRIRATRLTSMRSRDLIGRMRKARRILHSHKDACTFQTCATAGIPQESCRTQAESSHFRHNSQYSI